MLVITGWNSRIAVELRGLLEKDWRILPLADARMIENPQHIARATYDDMPLDADFYFFCAGYLLPKELDEMDRKEVLETYDVNYNHPMRACEDIFKANPKARICVMGSESGFSGSFNEPYAVSKRLLHEYVECRMVGPDQQLVAVAPNIIYDAGMTLRRTDLQRLNARQLAHPKKRFVSSLEVAKLVRFLLYEDQGYITNVVIRMTGGEHVK